MALTTFLHGRPPARGLLWLALEDVATIQTLSIAADGGGGGTAIWSNAGTADCRIHPLSTGATSRVTAGRLDERSTHVVIMRSDEAPAMVASDRIAVTGRGTFEATMVPARTDAATCTIEVIQI